MGYELTGTVKVVQDAQTFGSGFTKREVVVTVPDDKYPQDINVEMVQKNVALLDGVNIGDEVVVAFDIRGREYNGKYFNNIQGWKIDVVGTSEAPAEVSEEKEQPEEDKEEDMGDIPF